MRQCPEASVRVSRSERTTERARGVRRSHVDENRATGHGRCRALRLRGAGRQLWGTASRQGGRSVCRGWGSGRKSNTRGSRAPCSAERRTQLEGTEGSERTSRRGRDQVCVSEILGGGGSRQGRQEALPEPQPGTETAAGGRRKPAGSEARGGSRARGFGVARRWDAGWQRR